jgi:hypothetical protein
MIEWLQKWYLEQCDGGWEHEYGITIGTLDNPGWTLDIDLAFTHLQEVNISPTLWEDGEDNWLSYSIKERKFYGNCDPTRLNLLINVFKEIFECSAISEIDAHLRGFIK